MPLPPRNDPGLSPAAADRDRWQRSELVVWGAHGGAGTTTLATWLQPSWDAGAMRPEPDAHYPAELAAGRTLVVACRNTAPATALVTKAVAIVRQQGGQVAVVAVVSDGWPDPATAISRLRLLEPNVGAVIPVPFVAGLRLSADPASVSLPRRALRALVEIQAAAGRAIPL